MATSVKIKRLLALAIVLVSIYLAVHIAVKVKVQKPAAPPKTEALPEGVDLSLEQLSFSEVQNGATKWELTAKRADHDREKGATILIDPVMTVPPSNGHGVITLTADRAVHDKQSGDVHLSGNVVAKGDKGATFSTGHAEYHSSRNLVSTSDKVRFQQLGLTVTGVGMDLSTETRNIRIRSGVEAVVIPSPRK